MSRTITVKAEVQVPRVPNFLKYGGGTLDIADLADTQLREIAAAWTEELLANARHRRAHRKAEVTDE